MSEPEILPSRIIDLADYQPHPQNYKEHPDGQVIDLAGSLSEFGQFKNIVVWRGQIIAGHGLVLAAQRKGWTHLEAKVLPDDWPEHKALAVLMADNELPKGAVDNVQALAALAEQVRREDEGLARLAAGGEEGLKRLMEQLDLQRRQEQEDPGAQIDKAAELQEKWGTELGQLWQLGEHRLICGDCTDKAVVDRVMGGEVGALLLTDPPYNVGIEYGAGTNDRKTLEQNEAFIRKWFETYKAVPVKVVTPGVGYGMNVLRSWLTMFPPRWMCLWVRRNGTSRMPLRGFQQWEPILFYENEEQDADTDWGSVMVYGKPPARVMHDVFDIPVGSGNTDVKDENGNKLHPVPKPLLLFQVLLRAFSELGLIVVDPFLGSGTTLIACERLGRRCRAVEIEPAYVAVALERWSTMTGKQPVLLT